MSIDVTTPVFEGPFDLLLHLILREQVDLYEISLATIVDGYLDEIERMRDLDMDLDLDVATSFLLIAATLVELKARRLLPGADDVELDDELALWEARDLLLARLLECKTFKDVAVVFMQLGDDADRSFPRVSGPDERFDGLAPDLLAGVTPTTLAQAATRALTPRPSPVVDLSHVAAVKMTVAETVTRLVDRLPNLGRVTLRQLTSECDDRLEIIVHFLAVLELYKQGAVELDQADWLGEIAIEWQVDTDGILVSAAIDDYEG